MSIIYLTFELGVQESRAMKFNILRHEIQHFAPWNSTFRTMKFNISRHEIQHFAPWNSTFRTMKFNLSRHEIQHLAPWNSTFPNNIVQFKKIEKIENKNIWNEWIAKMQ
jgi:hypothetical protein